MGYTHNRGGGRGRGRGRGSMRGYGRAPRGKSLGNPTWKGTGEEGGGGAAGGDRQGQQDTVRGRREEIDRRDRDAGIEILEPGDPPRLGWLYSMASCTQVDPVSEKIVQATDFFFVGADGSDFRATMAFRPYFYISAINDNVLEIETSLQRLCPHLIASSDVVELQDMDRPNHLSAKEGKPYLRVECWTERDLKEVRFLLQPYLARNRAKKSKISVSDASSMDLRTGLDLLSDIREHDVQAQNRLAIDTSVRVGYWYRVDPDAMSGGATDQKDENGVSEKRTEFRSARLELVENILERGSPPVLAFDIECTKQPLRFPDADGGDLVMMISWMVDGKGFLGVNREVVSADIDAFTYTPKPEFPGDFRVFNEKNERALLSRFFDEVRRSKARVVVTYNGDYFDLPFIDKRCAAHGMSLFDEIGIKPTKGPKETVEYRSRTAVHMDCLYWVNRDSMLPQGSRGLKAVTRTLLGYDPLELDPEEMTPAARERPQLLASYSVSDAVCTYYLYMKYIHPFIFSLCNILPLNPDDVLRKGSGTLCELLLMSEAKLQGIVAPNKHESGSTKYTSDGHILENETYIGGHVEALQSGIFRSDIPMKFQIDRDAVTQLEGKVDKIIRFALQVEGKLPLQGITNYDQVKEQILSELAALKEKPVRTENPLIYHLDVGAMYPNIILTNRLQPHAIVNSSVCAACDFNGTTDCQRYMNWTWRGEHYTASRAEVEMLRRSGTGEVGGDLKDEKFVKRLKDYSRKNYRKITDARIEERVATVCQREHSFYVDTVRAFRDRRYDHKQQLKKWRRTLAQAEASGSEEEVKEAKSMVVLYDSMQLAHKIILNSFYGYVMRRGARWYSMEMAGVVTLTGANIIKGAREFVDRIGVPLELDTDGIWCALPVSFPENFTLTTTDGRKHTMSFICSYLNLEVSEKFTNHQYQVLKSEEDLEYEKRSECSIFFEVDGPYRAMVLPAAKEENKQIKKRYAVFNHSGELTELKGFEMKRRGELKLVKVFQSDVFQKFLEGETLADCYASVASVANRYMDVLEEEGSMYDDESLIELLVEQNNMSKSLSDYEKAGQKSSAITTAKRLAELLGEQMVRDKVTCKYIISRKPEGTKVTERALPVQVFGMEPRIRRNFLRRWTKAYDDLDLRSLIDWEYYAGRLVSSINKIICIPAALQHVENPVPRIQLPDWLMKRHAELLDPRKQTRLTSFLVARTEEEHAAAIRVPARRSQGTIRDIEDFAVSLEGAAPLRMGAAAREPATDQLPDPAARTAKPKIQDGYQPWLQYMKHEWREKRKRRLMERLERKRQGFAQASGAASVNRRKRVGGVFDHFQVATESHSDETLLKSLWQILNIESTATPGIFRLWVLPLGQGWDGGCGSIFSVLLRVPRVFYINSTVARKEELGKPVPLLLPRGHQRLFLHRAELAETEFLHKSKELTGFLQSSDVEGSYCTRSPLEFEAVVRLGCVCRPVRLPAIGREGIEGTQIPISDLEPVDTTKQSQYLTGDGDVDHAFLYAASSLDRRTRALFTVVIPEHQYGLLVAVSADSVRIPVDADRIFAEVCEENRSVGLNVRFHIEHVSTFEAAGKAIQRALSSLKDGRSLHKRTVFCCQSSLERAELDEVVSLRSFARIHFPFNDGDREFQPLQWQRSSFKTSALRYFEVRAQLDRHRTMARFGGIPLGNLCGEDAYLRIYDVQFARELQRRNHVLWASDGIKPDLGGHENDEQSFKEEDRTNPEHSRPGVYRTTCVESEFMNLAVASVLASSQLTEVIEGTELAFDISKGGKKGADPAEAIGSSITAEAGTACIGAFKVLRDLLLRFERASQTEGASDEKSMSTDMLDHFYRWLRCEHSLLYDPALHGFVHNMMRKVFRYLLVDLEELGAVVAYASVSKIILCTPKQWSFDGLRYAAFIESTLREKALFRSIRFAPLLGVYSSLLFVDGFNFVRVPAPQEREIFEGEAEITPERASSAELPASRMSWAMAKALPAEVAAVWMDLVDSFMRLPLAGGAVGAHADASAAAPAASTNPRGPAVRAFLRDRSGAMFEEVHRIQEKAPTLPAQSVDLQRQLNPPPLEFVNMLMYVFGLDETVQAEVANLRRGLLRLLGVPEFAPRAAFTNPSPSFRLPDQICGYCERVVDLDVTKSAADSSPGVPWRCAFCGHPYNTLEIELALVREVQISITSYQVQDLKCKRCHMVKRDNLAEFCSCSGAFDLTFSSAHLEQRMRTLLAVATRHQLPVLDAAARRWLQLGGRADAVNA